MPHPDDWIPSCLLSVTQQSKWALCSHFSTPPVLYCIFQAWHICHRQMTAIVQKWLFWNHKTLQHSKILVIYNMSVLHFIQYLFNISGYWNKGQQSKSSAICPLFLCFSPSTSHRPNLKFKSVKQKKDTIQHILHNTPLLCCECVANKLECDEGFLCFIFHSQG